MSGDYSRIRFDPRKDIASVWMQQGRVQLDSDWNEGMAALDRRLRAESVDTFGVHPVPGRTGVAVVSPQTPDAFKIKWGDTGPTIGRGRMYVDGLLVENYGGGKEVFDPVLAELHGDGALPYVNQPYCYKLPLPQPESGHHLAYLEVWQRELTHLQYPEMVENAVGVDTTTRWQTVWQVRFLLLSEGGNERPDVNCSTPDDRLPEWQALIRPSAGRMSIKAEVTPPDTGPCELPPSGGYRGLENQLYRIEIHDGGAAGTATFKWSRDNASVASAVVEIVSQTADSTELKLASLGRDAVLRFDAGDWVEILDDRCELDGENSNPALRRGVIRQITVDNAKQTIQFSPALPADLIPAGGDDTLAARHTRMRRWDQKGTVRDTNGNLLANLDDPNSSGLIPISALGVWVELEKGIQVRFSLDPAGGEFRSGDYWVSAARTADTSIETFTDAPPRGIHRHYARLAIVDLRDNERVISDCRIHWPPACGGCCTITVAPGESIQAALDALPDEGGCVCLKTGVHIINEPIRINRSNVILQGESPGAVVRSNGTALIIGGTTVNSVIVQRIRFEAKALPGTETSFPLLQTQDCTQLRVADCEFIAESPSEQISIRGLLLTQVADVTITSNVIQNMGNGITVAGNGGHINILDNFIEGTNIDEPPINGEYGISIGVVKGGLNGGPGIVIKNNHLLKFQFAIGISGVHDAVVDDNFIRYSGYGIYSIKGERNRVRNNRVDAAYIGIALRDESDPEISGNHLYLCGSGMLLVTLGAVNLLNNRLMNCGYYLLPERLGEQVFTHVPSSEGVVGVSIYVSSQSSALCIDGCELINTGIVPNNNGDFQPTHAFGIIITGSLTALQVTNNCIDYINVAGIDSKESTCCALYFYGEMILPPELSGSTGTLINSNHFRSFGEIRLALVEFKDLLSPDRESQIRSVTFSNNICDYFSPEKGGTGKGSTVILEGSDMRFIVMGNQIASVDYNSLSLVGKGAVCIGNTMTGGIRTSVRSSTPSDSFVMIPTSTDAFNIINSAIPPIPAS